MYTTTGISMSRCIICNFCPDTDNQPGNFLVNPELCMQCHTEIDDATFYDEEDDMICDMEKVRTLKYEMWRVKLDDEVIVEEDRDPEHAACRALKGMGYKGTVSFRHKGSKTISSTKDIEEGSRWTVREPANGPARLSEYEEFRPGIFSRSPSDLRDKDVITRQEICDVKKQDN